MPSPCKAFGRAHVLGAWPAVVRLIEERHGIMWRPGHIMASMSTHLDSHDTQECAVTLILRYLWHDTVAMRCATVFVWCRYR